MTVYISRDDSEALAHYGVMGMKWGVRKDPERYFSKRSSKIEGYQAKENKWHEKAVARRNRNLAKRKAIRAQRKFTKQELKIAKLEAKAATSRKPEKTKKYADKAAVSRYNLTRLKNRAAGSDRRTARYEARANKYNVKSIKVARKAYNKYSKISTKDWLSKTDKAAVNKSMKIVNSVLSNERERTERFMRNNTYSYR